MTDYYDCAKHGGGIGHECDECNGSAQRWRDIKKKELDAVLCVLDKHKFPYRLCSNAKSTLDVKFETEKVVKWLLKRKFKR
jgi:hypothetical protein